MATTNKPILQPERVTASDDVHLAPAKIIEIRNVTLKEALQMVRALADHPNSRE